MRVMVLGLGLLLIGLALFDGFETILLPRRVNRRFRYARLYYRTAWSLWRRGARLVPEGKWREAMLAVFGPLSMLGLFGVWVTSLIVGFALLHWALPSTLTSGSQVVTSQHLRTYLYFSGTTFVTLGLGDLSPHGMLARTLTVVESGMGFGFLAIIISYLPVLYGAFSRREVMISLLDARAGSPPSAGELLARLAHAGQLHPRGASDVGELLREWERWCAELLESKLSFPVLAYYRSQHSNQSWLAALATVLDLCALLLSTARTDDTAYPAQLTFAMARHAAVDISLIFSIRPATTATERLWDEDRAALFARLRERGVTIDDSSEAHERLKALRGAYEPFLLALAEHFVLTLPAMAPAGSGAADNWQRSAWMPRPPGIGSLPAQREGDHFG